MADNDQDIADYIEKLPRHLTFTRIADACRKRFGPRTWSRSRIVTYWHATHPPMAGRPFRIAGDADVRTFVEDRLGRLAVDRIIDECRRKFGPTRTPSRSAVHRYWQKVRRDLTAP